MALVATGSLGLLAGCDSEAAQAVSMRDTESSGYVTVVENTVDVGTIAMSEGNITIPYTFRNDGNEPVALLKGETSCMCTTARIKGNVGTSARITMRGHGPAASINQVLAPGEEAELIATFDPNAHGPDATGPISRNVYITTNSGKTPTVQFRFLGTVVP